MSKCVHKIVDKKWEKAVPLCLLSEVDTFQKSGYIYERISKNIFCQIKLKFVKYSIGSNFSEEPKL
jgi:hypothetical protein